MGIQVRVGVDVRDGCYCAPLLLRTGVRPRDSARSSGTKRQLSCRLRAELRGFL